MKEMTVTVFEAEDGTQFKTQEECENHELSELERHIKKNCGITHIGIDDCGKIIPANVAAYILDNWDYLISLMYDKAGTTANEDHKPI